MRHLLPLPLLLVIGCGSGAPPPAEEPKAEPAAASSSDASVEGAPAAADDKKAEDDGKRIPEKCAGDEGACVMPRAFVMRLCAKAYPELALYFFQKGSPWRRAHVAVREAAPFNGLNGPSSEEKLVFEEELLVLGEKKVDTGGMQVSGAGSSYDVLRWDGTCATMSAEEVRLGSPPKPKHATITWRFLEDATQNALLQNEKLAKLAEERRKECKGATMGNVTDKCEKADRKLNQLIAEAIRGGTTVPLPEKKP